LRTRAGGRSRRFTGDMEGWCQTGSSGPRELPRGPVVFGGRDFFDGDSCPSYLSYLVHGGPDGVVPCRFPEPPRCLVPTLAR
jgi:hypothetical protein